MGIERLKEFWPDWEIVEQIGTGAFGKVYKAVNNEAGFPAYSAIKVLSIPSSEAELDALLSEGITADQSKDYFKGIVDDFVNEIKLMHTLKGAQNIVAVDTFKIAEKTDSIGWDIFIRMELLRSFKDYLSENTPDEKDVVKLGIDIANALEICQRRNIIHRDIKPANIFIDDFGSFKLGDFGIAKELEKTTGAISSKGTFSYMAPEVAHGLRYDSTVDIYSLGLVMYSLLNNNKPPFVDPYSNDLNFNERKTANDRRLSGEPLPPPCNASQKLADIILTACSHDPKRRFKSAQEFKNALKNYETEPTQPQTEAIKDPDETVALDKPPADPAAREEKGGPDTSNITAVKANTDKTEMFFKGRLLPNSSNLMLVTALPILLTLLEILFVKIFSSGDSNLMIIGTFSGLNVGILACITFYYPYRHALLYASLYMVGRGAIILLTENGYISIDSGIFELFCMFVISFVFIYLMDCSKNKYKRGFVRIQFIVATAAIAPYIACCLLLTIIFISTALNNNLSFAISKASAYINNFDPSPSLIIYFFIRIPASIGGFRSLYSMTVEKYINQNN